MSVKAEVSTTLTIVRRAPCDMLLYAKQQADREFDRYFPKIHPYITRIEAQILREIFLAEGYVGYLIRVYVTCPLEVVQEFHKATGVYVDIPPEQITYLDEKKDEDTARKRIDNLRAEIDRIEIWLIDRENAL